MPRFLILVLFALAIFAVCRSSGSAYLAVAIMAAVAASLSLLDGFLVWPAIALLIWFDGRPRRVWRLGVWALSALVTAIVYFIGFDFGKGNTGDIGDSIRHPIADIACVAFPEVEADEVHDRGDERGQRPHAEAPHSPRPAIEPDEEGNRRPHQETVEERQRRGHRGHDGDRKVCRPGGAADREYRQGE